MSLGTRLLRERRYADLWQRYCGFLDLRTDQFMAVQKSLLREQLELLGQCELGRRLTGRRSITSVEDFRRSVPLTTYSDYAPYLLERREDVLPAKPVLWQRTTGAAGEHPFKWVPITQRMYEEMGTAVFSILVLATARFRGDISFGEEEHLLYALAPPPFATGCWGRRVAEELPVCFLPPLEQAEKLTFEERLGEGLRLGLDSGVDLVFGLPSVLVAIGEQIGGRQTGVDLRRLVRKPGALSRSLRAKVLSLMARRTVQPRDLWKLKGIATTGAELSLYRQRIKQLWGRTPLEVYGCTEGMVIAVQTWDYQDMTFLPYFNFLEFIPEEQSGRSPNGYPPRTLLLDEVEAGKNYELVITSFHGGAFVRYRLGDMVSITALNNDRLGIQLPRMAFYARCDGVIDLGSFARLTEKTIGEAVSRSGIPYRAWTARKVNHTPPMLHLYVELKGDGLTAEEVRFAIHEQLKQLHEPYAEMESLLRVRPLEVTLLRAGAFEHYRAVQQVRGAEPGRLRAPHVNPSDQALQILLQDEVLVS